MYFLEGVCRIFKTEEAAEDYAYEHNLNNIILSKNYGGELIHRMLIRNEDYKED